MHSKRARRRRHEGVGLWMEVWTGRRGEGWDRAARNQSHKPHVRCGRIARCLIRLPNATSLTPRLRLRPDGRSYLERIGDERVLIPDVEAAIGGWSDPMPEEGVGALTALTELVNARVRRRRVRAGRGSFTS